MDFSEAYAGWQKLGTRSQIGFIVGFIGTAASILVLAGFHTRMPLTGLIILAFFCGFWMLFYDNIQQSRKLAKADSELSEVDNRIDRATQAVYIQKNEEIRKLEIEVATSKDHPADWQEKRL